MEHNKRCWVTHVLITDWSQGRLGDWGASLNEKQFTLEHSVVVVARDHESGHLGPPAALLLKNL